MVAAQTPGRKAQQEEINSLWSIPSQALIAAVIKSENSSLFTIDPYVNARPYSQVRNGTERICDHKKRYKSAFH